MFKGTKEQAKANRNGKVLPTVDENHMLPSPSQDTVLPRMFQGCLEQVLGLRYKTAVFVAWSV